MINPEKYLPADIRSMLQCEMVNNCHGLHCCIDLSFQLPLGDITVTYHIPFWFIFEPCEFKVDVRFGGYNRTKFLLDYDWGNCLYFTPTYEVGNAYVVYYNIK